MLTGGIDNTNSQSDVNLALGQITGIGTAPFSAGPGSRSSIPSLDRSVRLEPPHHAADQPSHLSGPCAGHRERGLSIPGTCKGFGPGTQLSVAFNNSRQNLNSGRIDYNPYTVSSLGFTVTQPLLQGFGIAINKRFIRIARNNEKIADLTFRQQLVATVSARHPALL